MVLESLDPVLPLPLAKIAVVVSNDAVPIPVDGEATPVVKLASFVRELKFHWVTVAAESERVGSENRGKNFICNQGGGLKSVTTMT